MYLRLCKENGGSLLLDIDIYNAALLQPTLPLSLVQSLAISATETIEFTVIF